MFEADRVAVGARMLEARTDVGMLNASEFARAIGVAPNSVYRYERGEQLPSGEVLLRVAKATGRTVEWLLEGAPTVATEALAAWRSSATGQSATEEEFSWIARVDLAGHAPTAVFYDILLSARRHGLAAPDAVKAAAAGRKATEG